MLKMPEFISMLPADADFLKKDLYHFANYEQLEAEATAKGIPMKESKEIYGQSVLCRLESLLKGKSMEEIERIIDLATMDCPIEVL